MTTTTIDTLTGTYCVDPMHSRIGFVGRQAIVTKVRGSLNEFEGSGYFEAPKELSPAALYPSASIDTRNADRGAHLR